MKASASIIVSCAMGALVTAAFVGWVPGASSAGPKPERQLVTSEPRYSPPAPRRSAAALRRAAPAPRRVQGPSLINIPRLRLRATIGMSLNRGPAWWPVTGRPGGGDTIAIAGHRTTHTRPFYWLDKLRPGDAIYVRWAGRMHAYRVSGRRILSSKQLHIGDARGHEILLLSACHPRGSARQRIVVYAWPRA